MKCSIMAQVLSKETASNLLIIVRIIIAFIILWIYFFLPNLPPDGACTLGLRKFLDSMRGQQQRPNRSRRRRWPRNECKCEWTSRRRTRSSIAHSLAHARSSSLAEKSRKQPQQQQALGQKKPKQWPQTICAGSSSVGLSELTTFTPHNIETSSTHTYTHEKERPPVLEEPPTPATRAIPRLAPKKLLISLRSKRQTKPKFCTHEMYTDNGSPFIMQNPNSKLSFDPLK